MIIVLDIRDRVKVLRNKLGLSQEEFGERLSLERSSISLIERKQRNLTDRTTKDICREFNVDYIWLTTGQGEMFHQSDDEIEVAVEKIMYGESEFHKNLFKTFLSLGEEELLALEKIMDTYDEIVKKENKKS